MLMGIADSLMLSQYSDLGVAAVGNANRIVGLFTVLLNVVAIGIGVIVSQYVGAGEEKEANHAIRSGLLSSAVISLFFMAMIQLLAPSIFRLINVPESIYQDSLTYLRIVSAGLIFVAITQAISASLKSHGYTKRIMVVVGFTNFVNVTLNLFLIFGLWIFPELGVTGAAIATFISKALTLTIALILIKTTLSIKLLRYKNTNVKKNFIKIMRIGIPSAFEHFVYQTTQVIILSFLNTIGTIALTTQIYVFNLMMPVIVFSLAVAQGNQVMVGWYIGAKHYDEAYKRTLSTLRFSILIVISVSIMMYTFARPLIRIFTDNPDIIEMGKRTMFVVIFLEIGRLSNLVVIQALRAGNDVIFPVIIAIISMLGVSVPAAYMFAIVLDFGVIGIFMGFALDELLRGTLVLIRWIKKDWQQKAKLNSITVT
jgi:putative MATE family efflux protein